MPSCPALYYPNPPPTSPYPLQPSSRSRNRARVRKPALGWLTGRSGRRIRPLGSTPGRRAVVCGAGGQSQRRLRRASGGPGSGKRGVCRPAGCLLGGECPVGCPPRLAPEATRLLPGAQPAAASAHAEGGCRRLHSRQKPGRASPARRGEQPTSAKECALRSAHPA